MPVPGSPVASSARRIAPTRPSIMSDGETKSAPASACDTAAAAITSTLASLTTCPSSTMPQWPWLVYSQRQVSAKTTRPGAAALTSAIARWAGPSGAWARDPRSSFTVGTPKISTPGTPTASASLAITPMRCAGHRKWPGREARGSSSRSPSATKSGSTKRSGDRRVSASSRRRPAVLRSRRSR